MTPATPPTVTGVRRPSAPSSCASRFSALGLLSLALCIFLWGLGYKLSLYHLHRSADSRVPTAKLWLEPGNERTLHVPARAYALEVPDANANEPDALLLRELGRTAFPADRDPLRSFVQVHLPSRAPPAGASSGLL